MPANHLFDRDELGFDEWARTPKPEHLVPDSIERERARSQFRAELRDDPAAVVITHTDADGLSSAALIADYCGPDTVVQPIDYNGAYRFEHVVEDLLRLDSHGVPESSGLSLPSTDLYVCDFNLDGFHAGLDELGRKVRTAAWYDHHQWDDGTADAVRAAGFDLVIDEDECTASLLIDALPDANFEPYLEELAEVTKDIDLWIREDPRSERLNTFAAMVDQPEDYVHTVLECGVDLPDDVEERIDERQAQDEELEEAAVERATHYLVNEHDVAVTYSRGGRSSVIGNTLVEDLDDPFDIAVVLKSHGGIGIYSHSDREEFDRCHEVADVLGGGGHPTAAGCSVPVENFRDLATYWAVAGESVHSDIRYAIRVVVAGGEDDG